MRSLCSALILMVLFALPARAEDLPPTLAHSDESAASLASPIIETTHPADCRQSCLKLVSYSLALVSIFGAVWLLKRRPNGFLFRGKKTASIQVRETLSLGGKHYVAIIGCEDRHFLVGITPQSITTLGEIGRKKQGLVKKDLSEKGFSARG